MSVRLRSLFRRFRSWFFALTAASTLVLAPVATAFVDVDGDTIDDGIELATERNVAVATYPHVAPYGLTITSQSVGADVNDKFRVRYEAGAFEVEYFPNASAGRVASKYTLEILSIVEWIDDVVPNGSVDDGEVASVVPLGDSGFGGLPVQVSEYASADGGNVDEFTIRSAGERVTLTLIIAQRFLRVSPEKVLTPMEAKLDIRVNHSLVSPGARVGLEFAIDTDDEPSFGDEPWDVKHDYSINESWINVTGGSSASPSTVFFSWSNDATVDGVSARALVTRPQGGSGSYRMFAVYPVSASAQTSALHVASIGVVSEAFADLIRSVIPLGDPILFVSSFVVVAATVGASMIIAKRRRRKD